MRNLVHSIACGCLIMPLGLATVALAAEPQPVDTRGQPVSTRGKPATSSPTDPRTSSAALPEARSSDARTALELMRRHDLSLEEAIDAAEGHSNGQAVSAEHRLTGAGGNNSPGAGTPVVEVVCVDKQNNVALVWIDMATGKVAGSRDLTRVSSLGDTGAWGTSIVKAQDIMGKNVKNPRGESLGEIEDLALDAERGRIAYAVLSFGGIMGINEKLFLVPWAALASQRGETFILDIPKERLTNAPGFDPRQWPNLADVEFARTIHTYYNQPPYWELSDDEVATRTSTVVTLSPVYKVSDFRGRNVVTARNENLGEIEDLAIDPHSGRIAYAVLSFGGFLGINDKFFAIPWSSLTHSMDGKCVLDVDKERLKNAPGFDKNQWPDMANPEWSRSVRDYYKQPSPDRPAR